MRWHLLPHVLFLVALAGLAALGALRLSRHFAANRAASAALTLAAADVQRLGDVRRLARDATELVGNPDAPAPTRAEAVSALVAGVRGLAGASPTLAADPFCRQLQERAAILPGALAIADLAVAAAELDQLEGLTADALNAASRRLAEPAAAVVAASATARRDAVAAGVLVVLLAGLYFCAVYHYLANPLRRLAATVRRVTDGQLNARANATGDGPVAAVAADLNQMIEILVEGLRAEQRVVQELEQRTRDLEQANRHKSLFLATVSHELKTPLNAIIGFADILASGHHGPLSDRQRDYVARLGAAGQQLLTLISDLIDTARVDAGTLALNDAEFDARTLVDETLAQVRPLAAARGHTLAAVPVPAPLILCQDRGRVRQVLLNLLANAIKFTPDGGRLEVAAAAAGDGVALSVRDNGIGIPPADQARIFEDFVQLDSSLHRRHEGTGIGLALSRRLARMMGGDLTVASAPGAGSCFTLRLPRQRAAAPGAQDAKGTKDGSDGKDEKQT